MRVVCAAAMIVMLAWPAYAQDNHVPRYGEEDKEKSAVEKQADKAAERAYERSLGNIPDKGGSTDPWGIARSTDAPKAAAKTPAAKEAAGQNRQHGKLEALFEVRRRPPLRRS
jgi:hypothetical protein